MVRTLLIAASALVVLATPAAPQDARTWVSGWGGVFMDPGTVRDGESGTRWDFGTSLAVGAQVQRELGGSLIAGVEVGYSPIRHEVRDLTTNVVQDEGRAHLLTTMLVGRLGAAPSGGFAYYIAGGAGAMTYGIPSLDRWDSDLALRGGAGLDYRGAGRLGLFLEWYRWWVFHQAEGVDDNTVRHSHLQLGVRFGI